MCWGRTAARVSGGGEDGPLRWPGEAVCDILKQSTVTTQPWLPIWMSRHLVSLLQLSCEAWRAEQGFGLVLVSCSGSCWQRLPLPIAEPSYDLPRFRQVQTGVQEVCPQQQRWLWDMGTGALGAACDTARTWPFPGGTRNVRAAEEPAEFCSTPLWASKWPWPLLPLQGDMHCCSTGKGEQLLIPTSPCPSVHREHGRGVWQPLPCLPWHPGQHCLRNAKPSPVMLQ